MKSRKLSFFGIMCNILIYALAIVFILPFLLSLLMSVKTKEETAQSIFALPKTLHFENFINAMEEAKILQSFSNSILVTAGTVIIIIICASLGAYGIGRYYHKKSMRIYEMILMASMMIPFQTLMTPLYKMLKNVGMLNTHIGAILIIAALNIPFSIMLYTGFVRSIPIELEEAAQMEGYGPFKIFLNIVFPLLKPATVTVATLMTLWTWNEFNVSLIILQKDSIKTIPMQQYVFFGQYSSDYNLAFAAAIITMIPIILFFLFAQKHIEEGLIEGAVKG
ncbi:carbohydrate ABC transporter permease [Murimonas intestini]|uniref:carbohydrate ABC transporter permease n=1 Tax=Murimonas intestini TaxID=1337051 RepID=UPI0011DD5827|nr:carbohydrate ABC transporter permease [Murimonas intestini]